jgi:hypothetical protein
MKMRLIVLLVFTIVTTGVAMAQLSFGIRGGVNLQNVNGKDFEGDKLENDLTPGFHAGVDVEIPVAPDFYFQPGLLFSTKGASDTEGKLNLGYVELPLHFLYKPMLGSGKLIIGLGPYVAYGVTGKIKPDEGSDIDIKFKSDLSEEDLINELEGEAFHLKAFDAGADIFFGYQFAFNLYVQLNAQLGLLDIYPNYDNDEEDETVFKNTGFGLSLGYRF